MHTYMLTVYSMYSRPPTHMDWIFPPRGRYVREVLNSHNGYMPLQYVLYPNNALNAIHKKRPKRGVCNVCNILKRNIIPDFRNGYFFARGRGRRRCTVIATRHAAVHRLYTAQNYHLACERV